VSALFCPACPKTALTETSPRQGLAVDHCAACGGAWLDIGEVYHFTRDPKSAQAALKAAYGRVMPTTRRCPRCSRDMKAARLEASGVLIEACPACGGTWFDKGELASFAASLSPVPAAAPAPKPAPPDGSHGDDLAAPDADAPRPTALTPEESARFAGADPSLFIGGTIVVCGFGAMAVLYKLRGALPMLDVEGVRPYLVGAAAVLLTAVPAARASSAKARRLRGAWRVAGTVSARQEFGGVRSELVVRYAFAGAMRGAVVTVEAGTVLDVKVGGRLWVAVRPDAPDQAVAIPPP
jgi:Zn-finger nucleic acid-binding protein